MRHNLPFSLLLILAFLAACAPSDEATNDAPADDAPAEITDTAETSEPESTTPTDRGDAVTVAEAWASPFDEADNVDSVAFWRAPDGASWIVATAKESDVLIVYDAATGAEVRRVGGPGADAGRLQRPNGVMIEGDLVFVTERDNHRVQVFRLPDFETVGLVGADALRRPYGLAVFPSPASGSDEGSTLELYVTDNYETADEQIPPDEELGERVKHFRLTIADEGVTGELVRAFGETEGEGRLPKVETLLADPENDRLLVADEEGGTFEVYRLDGTFVESWGEGHFHHEAEGLALRACDSSSGYWIATDQANDVSFFRVFDRDTFEYRGTFAGEVTANTDGVALTSQATDAFPAGAFFAVHDDQGVTAFDWRVIAEGLGLAGDC